MRDLLCRVADCAWITSNPEVMLLYDFAHTNAFEVWGAPRAVRNDAAAERGLVYLTQSILQLGVHVWFSLDHRAADERR
jgi:hypothetical protein